MTNSLMNLKFSVDCCFIKYDFLSVSTHCFVWNNTAIYTNRFAPRQKSVLHVKITLCSVSLPSSLPF